MALAIMCIGAAATGWLLFLIGPELHHSAYIDWFSLFRNHQSLTLQWVGKDKAARFMGKQLAIKSFASLLAYVPA